MTCRLTTKSQKVLYNLFLKIKKLDSACPLGKHIGTRINPQNLTHETQIQTNENVWLLEGLRSYTSVSRVGALMSDLIWRKLQVECQRQKLKIPMNKVRSNIDDNDNN